MSNLTVGTLRCEYKRDPVGIDVPKPRISWMLRSPDNNVLQQAYQLQVSEDQTFERLIWDSGKAESGRSVHVEYGGPRLASRTRYYYRVRVWDCAGNESPWSEAAFWETGLCRTEEWTAQWITPAADAIDPDGEPCYLLRKEFPLRGSVKAARIYATSLGVYELYLNGSRVGDWRLTPGWTSYRHRLQYQTYDVTEQVRLGRNAVGIVLGNGWFKGSLAWQFEHNLYGSRRAALFQLHLTYEDGSEVVVGTDGSWRASEGPIRMADIYHGETYDARLEKAGWDDAGFDDTGWAAVDVLEHTKETLVAQENPPSRIVQEISPIGVIRTPAGETLLDFGQNMVGWVRFRAEAPSGTRLALQHAEILDANGNFYTENLRKAKQTVEYICKGEGTESFEPHFTFQGFRYVKVAGFPESVNPEHFVGKVVCSDMEPTGTFECSEPMINQLQSNIVWGQRGNFLDVPTDCPQRDERLGWTGDAQVFIRTAAFNMNVATFFTKWLRDLKAEQLPSGGVPHVIPNVLPPDANSSAAWADAAVICPWTLYLSYGDKRILEEQYGSMKAWVEYIRKQGEDEYLWNTGGHFGDWLGLDAKEDSYIGATPSDLIATAFYAYSTELVMRTARILNKSEDTELYRELRERVIERFNQEFVTPNGRLAAPTQTAHVLALMFGLVKGEAKARTIRTLKGYLEASNYHLTTGFVGTPYLCIALSEAGCHEIAAKIVMQKDYPSWLYPITKGATTIWEHWDGIKEDGSFWSDNMNSFNHYAYGSIGEWFYRIVAGIDTDEERPGYRHINFCPHPVEGWSYAKAALQSMYGEILSEWSVAGEESETLFLKVVIPANTTATLKAPDSYSFMPAGGDTLELGSGTYTFKLERIRQKESVTKGW